MAESDHPGLPVLDEAVLPRAVGNREEIIAQVVQAYSETLVEDAERLDEALRRDDAELVARLAHRIKGGAANLGGRRLNQLAASIEAAARAGDLPRCRTLGGGLTTELDQLLLALQKGPFTP